MSKCFVCGEREIEGDYSRVWVYMGKRAYCEKHVPSRKTLRRKVRELRASRGGALERLRTTSRTSANVTLGNPTSADAAIQTRHCRTVGISPPCVLEKMRLRAFAPNGPTPALSTATHNLDALPK